MTKFEEEFNYLIELSGKVLIGKVGAEVFEKNRVSFFEKYETDQQQALPVVPECVGELFNEYRFENIQRLFEFGIDDIKSNKITKALKWRDEHPDIFALAFITGKYEVEKPQLFYLKHIDMSKSDKFYDYFLEKRPDGVLVHGGIQKGKLPKLKCILKLTQQEIDSMQTGSYEKIEVAK